MDTQYLVISLVMLLFGVYITKGMIVCPGGWHTHSNNQCYWFSGFNATQQGAQSECASMNSSLVTVNNSNINTFLQQHIVNNTGLSYWIGLSIPNLNGYAWSWTSTNGLRLGFRRHIDWCDGHGIAGAMISSCAVAYYTSDETPCLKTYLCTTTQRFVCELEISRNELCPSHLYNNSFVERRSCYYVSNGEEKHTDAAKVCWNKGMTLVTVHDDGARRFMMSIRPGNREVYWVGLSPYKWVDGSAYNWNNWGYGPNITILCTVIRNDGTWDSVTCSDYNNVICQKGAALEFATTTTELPTSPSHAISMTDNINTPGSTFEITELLNSDLVTPPLAMKTETTHTVPPLMTISSKNTDLLYIIIGIMSGVIIGLTVAVVTLVLHNKRTLKDKQSTTSPSPQREILYEDTSTNAYYNVNIGSSVVNQTGSPEQMRQSTELTTDANGVTTSTKEYEVLDTGPYVNGLQHELSGPYATLK